MAEQVHEGPVIGHYGDHRAQTVWSPARYAAGPLAGPGRWCPIYSPVSLPAAGMLFTDDDLILGFMPVGVADNPHAPTVTHLVGEGLREAAALGRPAGEVFDAWADRVGLGLSAGPTVQGDLSTLLLGDWQ